MDRLPQPLSPRLAALVDAIVPGSRVADVGSGHGLLPMWLAAFGRAGYCLATEKTEALLAVLPRPPAAASWAARLGFRAGDGLEAIRAEDGIDTIVLAGLGGRTIVRLLDTPQTARSSLRRLVLQPRSEPALTRAWLSEHGWRPVVERLTEHRGRFHLTIAAERGDDAELYSGAGLERSDLLAAGPLLARSASPEFSRFWLKERDRLAFIVARSDAGPSLALARARSELQRARRLIAATSTPGG